MALYGGGKFYHNHISDSINRYRGNPGSNVSPFSQVVFGPVVTTWINFLARRVNIAGRPRLETLARVGCDQGAFAPVMIGVFLSSMATMEGVSAKERLEKTWWTALKTNWLVWPFVQMINFTFMPLQHRVLFANVISIGWNSYLSWVNSVE